jgi:AraC-like DNA-binding protein
MDYREHAPWPELAGMVSRIWTLAGDAGEMETSQPVLPDGQPELVLHFGDPFDRLDLLGRVERQPMVLFAGQLTAQLALQPTGAVRVLGIRFRPFGAAAFLAAPQHELTGCTIDVADIAPDLSRALEGVRTATDDLVVAAGLVQQILVRRIDSRRVDQRVSGAAQAVMRSHGAVAMDDLARASGMTRRHLERRFLDHVGIPPKRLARIARFQRALGVLENADPLRPGTEAAADCGYADQSHFIRDFRDLAGCSPSEHLLRQAELTRFFIKTN